MKKKIVIISLTVICLYLIQAINLSIATHESQADKYAECVEERDMYALPESSSNFAVKTNRELAIIDCNEAGGCYNFCVSPCEERNYWNPFWVLTNCNKICKFECVMPQ